MHCIVLPCRLITVFWLLCLQVTMAGPHSHFDRPLWKARPCRRTAWVYKLLMQIGQLEHSSAWFILCELQKLRFNFRGSIIFISVQFSNVSHEKKNNPNDKGKTKKTSHREKSSYLYKSVQVYGKQNTLTNINLYLGGSKHELDYS